MLKKRGRREGYHRQERHGTRALPHGLCNGIIMHGITIQDGGEAKWVLGGLGGGELPTVQKR